MTNLWDIPHEDVLFPMILSQLDLKCLQNLSYTCLKSRNFVLKYFSHCNSLSLPSNPKLQSSQVKFLISITKLFCNLQILSIHGNLLLNQEIPSLHLIQLCQRNSNLHCIKLKYLSTIHDQMLLVISHCCPHLKMLSIKGSSNITIIGIDFIMANLCHQITNLNISLCGKISQTDQLKKWIIQADNLQKLSVSNLPCISDDFINQLRYCKLLQRLNIRYCSNLTNASIGYLREYLPSLKFVKCWGCHNISVYSLNSLISRGIQIDIVVIDNERTPNLQI